MSTSARTRAIQIGGIGFAAVALGCAALAAFLVSRLISARGYTGDRVRPVVVAKHSLPAGQQLKPEDLDVMSWPEKHVPEGVVADPKLLFESGKPLVPTTGILEGEPIVPSRLANPKKGTALGALVRDGYRAIAIKIDDTVGRSGLVYPGATVDVIGSFKNEEHLAVAAIVAASVKVLGVEDENDVATRRNRSTDASDANKASFAGTVVTLEVAPDDARIISLINREGKIDLALRNASDEKPVSLLELVPLPSPNLAIDPASTAAKGQVGAAPTAVRPEPPGRGGRPGRRIELRAVDSRGERRDNPDKPEIETYHAR